MFYTIKKKDYGIIILGAGGTGSWLSQFLSKSDVSNKVYLVDGDVVELKNCKRQNFNTNDIDKHKASSIGKRFDFWYANQFLTSANELKEMIKLLQEDNLTPIICGCLDNNGTRALVNEVFHDNDIKDIVWLDGGNSLRNGQLYIAIKDNNNIELPSPVDIDEALQNIDGDERRPDQISCAEHSESAPQNITANITSATIMFNALNLFIQDEPAVLTNNKFTFNTAAMLFDSLEQK